MEKNSSLPAAAELHEAIRRRAEEIYFRSGRVAGRDIENWKQAESEVRSEIEHSLRRTAVVINLDGVQYVGEYTAEVSDGYVPGELDPGMPVPIRLEGDKMYVMRPNGKELETTIVQKIS